MSYVSDRPSTAPRPTADCPLGEPDETQFDARNPLTHSVEGSADALMDDVFADIERMVERGVGMYAPDDDDDEAIFERIQSIDRSSETAQPNESEELDIFSQKALEPEPSDALAVLPKVSPRELTMGEVEIDADVLLNLAKEDQPSRESSRSFDALLVSIIVATLAITGGIWFYLRHRTPAAITPTVEAPTPAETLKTQQEKEFLAYVQRSLERIDRSRKQADAVANANTSTTPTVLERI